MQNQAAVEALYSATFVEDYLDCVENLPNDLQRHLSRLREFDLIQYSEFLKNLDSLVIAFENEKTASGQRSILDKIQIGLIAAQGIGDDKLATVQAMSDLIENKARQLEHDSKNLDFGRGEEDDDNTTTAPPPRSTQKTAATGQNSKVSSGANNTSRGGKEKDSQSTRDSGKPPVKRRKKQQNSASADSGRSSSRVYDDDDVTSGRSGGGRGARGGTAPSTNKRQAVKRKSAAKRSTAANNDDSDREIDLANIEIDPEEPTYCLCDQVSYGEMIGCDNDLCPIEWFHFNCVQLSSKPKGKWFCPKCRGDKPTIMKPKAQFLKELEKFNRDREEKMAKQNG